MKLKLAKIIEIMENNFPLRIAEAWDNSGLQIGDSTQTVERVAIALDADEASVDKAIANKADLLITHHPLFFEKIQQINFQHVKGRIIRKAVQAGMAVYSAHTNIDAAPAGLNQFLAVHLDLKDIKALGRSKSEELLKLVVFVPQSHLDIVRTAILEAGAGRFDNYNECSFYNLGTSTFKPLKNSNPFKGEVDKLEVGNEYKLETVLYPQDLNRVLKALFDQHPYEEIAYEIYELIAPTKDYSFGRIGYLAKPQQLSEFALFIKERLNLEGLRVVGEATRIIERVAIAGGAGSSLIKTAAQEKADVFITGDIKYHEAQDAIDLGLPIIDAGHQGTEAVFVPMIAAILREEIARINGEGEIFALETKNIFKFF